MERTLDFLSLKNNLIEVTKEAQIKLGYTKDSIGFYYPLASLNSLLDSDLDEKAMCEALQEFSVFAQKELGNISISREKKRFCIKIPKEGVEYVYKTYSDTGFLTDFIMTIGKCHLHFDDILQVFRQYSDCVVYEKMDSEDFDYVIYFEDGKPDDFRYCIKFEACGAIYHRFTKKDYEQL